MFSIGKKIELLRKQEKLTRDELAEKTNISKQSIFNYVTERRLIPIDALSVIADFFKVPIESFFSDDYKEFKNIKEADIKRIPILSDVSAGYGKEALEEATDWISLPSSIAKTATFATFVEGDSMEPKINEGDLLLVQDTPQLDSGMIGVFLLNEKVYCKRFHYNPITKEIILKSLNSNYKPIKITNEDEFRIIGRVVGIYDYTV